MQMLGSAPASAIRHPPSAICHLPFAICHLPSAICHLPSAICHLPFAIGYSALFAKAASRFTFHTPVHRSAFDEGGSRITRPALISALCNFVTL
jgi:hypothetical protein